MRLPIISSKELCGFLERVGFHKERQKGSHAFYRHADGRCTVVPIHANKDISRGLLSAILEEIEMSREEFLKRK